MKNTNLANKPSADNSGMKCLRSFASFPVLLLFGSNLLFSTDINAQSWDMNLNTIKDPKGAKLGTLNNEALHIYTNGQERCSIGNDGSLNILSFSGEGNRFLQSTAEGRIFTWTGNVNFANHVLCGDGLWKPNPFFFSNNRVLFPIDVKLGIGGVVPETELDVAGSARISKDLTIGAQLRFVSDTRHANFRFLPGDAKTPNVLSFNAGLAKSGSLDSGNTENNGNNDPDPLPDLTCLNGNINTVNTFNNVVSVFAPYNSSSVGNINIGHNGQNAFIETQGTNPAGTNTNPGLLQINSHCDRNVVFFSDNGNPFNTGGTKIMSVHGRVNVSDLMQIGNVALTNFMETGSKLYVYGSGMQDGIKVRHGGVSGGAGIRAVELSDNDKGLAVFRGTQSSDGQEMFSVQGDGLTVISPLNSKAVSILKNNSETFSIDKDGYTEIKVYAPSGMPNNRVMSVVDMAANRDLFAIKSNGKVYAREIEINLLQNFPDYVFHSNYKLMPLNELNSYVNLNKHLPGFETAAYYEKNGLNVQEILIKQQEKIEELTLYLIQLHKQLNNR